MCAPDSTLKIGKGGAGIPDTSLKPKAAPTVADAYDSFMRKSQLGALRRARRGGTSSSLLLQALPVPQGTPMASNGGLG